MIILMCAIFFIFLPRDGLQVTGAYAWVGNKNMLCKDYWGYFDIEDEKYINMRIAEVNK